MDKYTLRVLGGEKKRGKNKFLDFFPESWRRVDGDMVNLTITLLRTDFFAKQSASWLIWVDLDQ